MSSFIASVNPIFQAPSQLRLVGWFPCNMIPFDFAAHGTSLEYSLRIEPAAKNPPASHLLLISKVEMESFLKSCRFGRGILPPSALVHGMGL